MAFSLPPQERTYLRDLAAKQAEYAALPVMQARQKMWYDLNDGVAGARPPVVIETWTFDRDFLPESIFRCQSELGRSIERQLLRNIRNHELIDDDKVTPDTFSIGWFTHIDEWGIKVEHHYVEDFQGHKMGWEFVHPIKDLQRDLHLLKPATCAVDKAKTYEFKAFLEELFEGRLPVRIRTGTFGPTMLTNRLIELMGMEAFFLAMYDQPDEVHQVMAYLRDNALRIMRWAEENELLRDNNGNQDAFGSSCNFNRQLAGHGDDVPVKLSDMFGCANSQETVGVSPQMFQEFCLPYYQQVCQPMGLLYYGCCEPASPFWNEIRQLPHLKKVSISRWCDQAQMGEALRGTKTVFSRKPDPNLLGVDVKLNEEAWSKEIRHTLEATRGTFVEFIVRDVYTVHGNLEKPRRAVELARAEVDRVFGG